MRVDAVVIGSGAGGGVAAAVLARSGRTVAIVERGRDATFAEAGRDHLRSHRNNRYTHAVGPDHEGNPRVFVDVSGREHLVRESDFDFHDNATVVGGGTPLYGAQAWRFLPTDFAMASEYGIPVGSSLADWPISYADLATDYERAEWEVGVCGDHTATATYWPGATPYPMPPLCPGIQAETVRRGARQLGWGVVPVPMLINSVERDSRPACHRCQHCIGFLCPTDAKNGTHNTVLRAAASTGRITMMSETLAESLHRTDGGRVDGVTVVGRDGTRQVVTAEVVVVAAGAIETARLLLNSSGPREPAGLGNNNDQVGRHLQGHAYASAFGEMDETARDNVGPGVTTATLKFAHHNDGVVGGAMLADDFTALPIAFWANHVPPGVSSWGAENKRYMREMFLRVVKIAGPVQEIPNPEARVRIDPTVRDKWGIAVARLSGHTHPETLRTARVIADRAAQWLAACGARRTWKPGTRLSLHAGQHQSGTCRMGNDPRMSVVDSWARVHGHENVFVADMSVHVTNGSVNPVLTTMALAFRTAQHIADTW